MGKQPRKVFYYTGPDSDNIKAGEYHSIKDWSRLINGSYSTLYARMFRGYIFKKINYLSQGYFNQLINKESADDDNEVWMEIDPEYLDRQKKLKELVLQELKNGKTTRVIAKILGVNQELITRVRMSMRLPKRVNVEESHKCKCPTCGQIYYRTGFYTGKGLWRKMHDHNECPIQADFHRRRAYKSEIHVTGLDLNSNTSMF